LKINEINNSGTTPFDTPPGVMHDKMMTKSGVTPRKKGKPFLRIKHGSAVVPIYKARTRKYDYYTVAFHLNGRRVRRNFGTLQKAKLEAQMVAKRIQEGLSATNDLAAVQRECYLALEKMVTPQSGWRKPSTLRAAVFICGALLAPRS
jgi:hypothetical protein